MVAILEKNLNEGLPEEYQFDADTFLCNIMAANGMQPPPIPVKRVRPANYRWGTMCTMRCVCSDCDPEFLVNEWEPE
jgi:hypothetical protein